MHQPSKPAESPALRPAGAARKRWPALYVARLGLSSTRILMRTANGVCLACRPNRGVGTQLGGLAAGASTPPDALPGGCVRQFRCDSGGRDFSRDADELRYVWSIELPLIRARKVVKDELWPEMASGMGYSCLWSFPFIGRSPVTFAQVRRHAPYRRNTRAEASFHSPARRGFTDQDLQKN